MEQERKELLNNESEDRAKNKTGLVLEGGGMRGIYTAGVLDVFLDEGLEFGGVIGVSGIGPKGGLNILSCMSPDELRFAIMSGDAKMISSAPGIGKKTAEKLIVELRDKVDIEKMLDHAAHPEETIQTDMAKTSANEMQSEAVQALVALGYGSAESLRAVKKTSVQCQTVEDILKEALQYLF